MIKTIATFTQTTPELPTDILNNIIDQCQTWQDEGKYTGEVDATYNPISGLRHSERWEWSDNAAAQAYKTLVESSWIELYPDVNVDIVVS